MNKKKIFTIILIVCFILSLQAISAASDSDDLQLNQTDDVNVVLSADSSSQEEILQADGDGTGTTFTDLQTIINDDTTGVITLDKNYEYDSTIDTSLVTGIKISKDITIDGQNKVTIDAKKQARIFNVASGATVTLKGITFINGNADESHGGAIYSKGVLHIEDCNFENNTAGQHGGAIYLDKSVGTTVVNSNFKGNLAGWNGGAIDWLAGSSNGKVTGSNFINNTAKRSGGAIHWSGHYGTISNSNFINNTATGEQTSKIGGVNGGGDGGAVLWVGSHGIIKDNCNFTNNFAQYRGGAIFLHGNSTENCTNTTITQNIFKYNVAGLNGGAIDWQEGAEDGVLTYSTFINNTAWRSGGAVYWYGTNGTISYCDFINNTAVGNVTKHAEGFVTYMTVGGNGGAITWTGTIGHVDHSTFTNNSADKLGGAVYLQGNLYENCTNTTFDWCNFTHNIAGINGGAIDWHEGAHDGNIYNSIFTNNIAKANGGAVFWSGHDGEILNSNFTNNTAQGIKADSYGDKGDGGAIMWTGLNGIVDHCRYINNSATNNGGAVFLQNCSHGACENTTFSNSYFLNNSAGYNGGAINWDHGAEKGHVIKSTFINNTAKRSGGAIYWSGVYGNITGSNFTGNKALGEITDSNGGGDGAAVLWEGSHGIISNSNFTANNATYRGGAMFLKGSDDVTIDWCKFDDNWAGTNGGAVDFQEGATNGHIYNSTFNNNTALRSAGAVYWFGTTGTIKDSNFTNNKATGAHSFKDDPRPFDAGYTTNGGNGGAIVWTGSHALVDNCTFENNSAAVRGGAVYLQRNTNSTFSNSHFINNTAGTNGGALDWFNGANDGKVINSTFENNTAKRSAGAIYWCGNNGLILNSNFTNNRALGSVYAINVYGVNTIGGDGGAISWIGSNGTIKNARFINNEAKYRGGAIYLQKVNNTENCRNVTIYNSTFIENIAGTNGGAVDWFQGAEDGKIDLSVFINNTAKRSGGAVYWNGKNGNVTNSNFTNNRALGIVHTDDRGSDVVTYTTQGGNGGAIIWTGDNGYVNNCRFINNTAPMRGGAVYLQRNENATFKNSLFANNTAGTNGGAIDWYEGAKNGLVDNVTFVNNTAKRSGGAIYWYGYNGTVKNSKFNNNRATGEYLQYNMTLTYDQIKVVNKNETEFLKTSPTESNVGNLYVLNYTNGSTHIFKSYVADKNGTTIKWLKLDETEVNVDTISPVDWGLDQFFGGDGGTILWSGDLGNIYNCSFVDSNSARRGGGAYMTGSDYVTFNKCNFTNCTSGTNGGGVDWLAGANYGKIYNCIFNNTRAARSAGAIYYDGWYGEIKNVTIINTKAWGSSLKESKDGRVKYAGWDSSHWDTNTTGGDAGAIMFTGNHEYVYNVTFTNCTATGRGGAIFLQENTNVTFELCEFKNNRALGTANNTFNDEKDESTGLNKLLTGHGGAIDFGAGATNATIKHSKFTNNTAARNGGALSFEKGSSNGVIINSTFDNNTAKASGGAISWDGTNGTVKYSNFTRNRALGTALTYDIPLTYDDIIIDTKLPDSPETGKLYIVDKSPSKTKFWYLSYVYNGTDWILLYNETLHDDAPSPMDWGLDLFFGGNGGTIIWGGDIGLIDHCNFKFSESARRGGGAYMRGSDNVTISNSNFTNGTSGTNGGGVDWLAGANYGKLINCTFKDNRAARSAGAIYYDGDYGDFHNVTIINNHAYGGSLKTSDDGIVHYAGWDSSHWDTNTTGGDAGAMMITGDHEHLYNITFKNNTAVSRGGAVFLQDNENVTFELCKFENNRALGTANNTYNENENVESGLNKWKTGHGGAIAFDVAATKGVIKDSKFINNTAARDGGAIYFATGSSNAAINNTLFENNTAKRSGGAISWDGINGNVTCCNFTNNSALGNVIDTQYVNLTSLSQIINVTSLPTAGASTFNKIHILVKYNGTNKTAYELYVTVKDGDSYSWLKLDNTTEVGPSHTDYAVDQWFGGDGGSILWGGDNGNIDHCRFIDSNSARRGGGAYMLGSDYVSVTNSYFENDTSGTNGGGLDWLAGANYGKVINCTFNNTQAARSAGAIYYDGDYGRIENITVIGTVANGGSLKQSKDGRVKYAGWDSSHWDTNTTGGDAGAIMFTGDHIYVYNATFTNCTAVGRGGAVFLQDNKNVTFDECKFYNNTALGTANNTWSDYTKDRDDSANDTKINYKLTGHGGAVAFDVNAQNCTIKSSEFINNTGRRDGGAINFAVGALNNTIKDTIFTNNSARDDGGAINWEGNVGTIENITCYDNKATGREGSTSKGGTICLTGNNVTITKSNFTLSRLYANTAEGAKINETDGGAIFVTGNNTKITDTVFDRCYSPNDAGAIYVIGNKAVIDNCTFTNCNATEDGGVLSIHGQNTTVANSTFTNNTAGDDGGAISWDGSYGKIYNITCENNKGISLGDSSSNGGTIILTGSNVTIEKSTFRESSALISGGAIFVTGNYVNITDSSFEMCNVSQTVLPEGKAYTTGGGSIYVLGNYSYIDNCTFDKSNGREGGALYIQGSDAKVNRATITHTYASQNGGAFYISGPRATISNSNISMSNATVAGGAGYIEGVNTNIKNTTFNMTNAKNGNSYNDNNKGGALYIKGNYANISDSEFDLATAQTGGSIYLEGSYCNITNSSFDRSHAMMHGGSIYSTGSYSNVVDSNFTNSVSDYNGGAIYWYGGTNSKYNTVDGCTFYNNTAYGKQTASGQTRGGGAIYWSENGQFGKVLNSKFINNSVQSTSHVDVEGGAILWDYSANILINNSIFDGNYVYTSASGAWVQGGAIYIRSRNVTISNSVFENCWSSEEAGALYLSNNNGISQTILAQDIRVINTKFINNTAKGVKADTNRNRGGGAVQVKESWSVVFINATFENNTASQGGACSVVAIKNNNHAFYNCTFTGNDAIVGNGGGLYCENSLNIYNTTFNDNNAVKNGGGAYWTNGNIKHNNLTFIGNNATLGGGLYWDASVTIQGMTFINNTAEYGGAVYVPKVTTFKNVNMTGNKAFSGSAIYSVANLTLNNVYLMHNRANSSSLTFLEYDETTGEMVLLFKGWDNYLNGIFLNKESESIKATNVTYWDENGVVNTGLRQTTLTTMAAEPTPEGGQNITVEIRDDDNVLLNPDNMYFMTDNEGKIYLNIKNIVPGVSDDVYVEAFIDDEDIYTPIRLTTRVASEINATADATVYHSNSTVYVNVTAGGTGNVSVYYGEAFLGNITLNNSKGSINISTLIENSYLPVGKHNLTFIYWGNARYDRSNTTAVLEITKKTPIILFNVTNVDYSIIVNVTVKDGEYNISDVTGNVTINVLDRTATIYLENSTGMAIIYGVPSGNNTVYATYNGDNNYYNTTNSTEYDVKIRTHSIVDIQIEVLPEYWVNDTVKINVSVFPKTTGNITLYLNGIPHNLTLDENSTAVFYAKDFNEGNNTIVATFTGNERLAPSFANASFIAKKFIPGININVTDMLSNETQMVNISLPKDAEGIIEVSINGSVSYHKLVNGSVLIPVSDLTVGRYNITVKFDGDKKYTNRTNSTLFNVLPVQPDINIVVENVTYGNPTAITVVLPEDATGNVTVKINDTYYVFDTQDLTDGKAVLPEVSLPAGNYTVEVTYNGDKNYTVTSAKANFTVYKAAPVVNVEVKDINYGENANITVTVPDGVTGQITIKINDTLFETFTIKDGKVNWTVSGLAAGNYPVEVIYGGNDNFTTLPKTADFNVLPIATVLDVEVHNVPIWDKEYINVTVRNATGEVITTATGKVVININGVNHTADIKDGVARFNTSDLTRGHKVAWVFYGGDRNLTQSKAMKEFDVTQRTPKVNVTAINVTVTQDGKITINIPKNATGFVILSGNFTKRPIYVDEFTNGVAEVNIGKLANGTYSVHGKYYGDTYDNYTSAENDTTFKVSKINATVAISVEDIDYTQKANITVTVPNGVTGNITLRLNDTGRRNVTLPIVNGKVTWIVDNLAGGNYTVYVSYKGDDNYNINSTESDEFEVRKVTPVIVIHTINAVTGERGEIAMNILYNGEFTNIDGETVNITGLDKALYIKDIENSIVYIQTDGTLNYASYTITVKYGGNENFTEATATQTFTPDKISNYEITVTGMNITVGDDEIITVNVPDGVTNVTIWVNGTKLTNDSFTNGEAKFNVTNLNLKEGVYKVNATVNDESYAPKVAENIFTVNKTNPGIKITVINKTAIYVNDTVKVVVTVPNDVTENVTIEINGKSFTNTTVGGNATFYIPQITYGNKTVVATYPGDDKYRFNSTTANFTVHKRQLTVIVDVDASTVGSDVTISVEIPANATGYVIVNVDGTNYTVNTTGGVGSVVIKGLGNTTHKVNVTYIGDDQYLPSKNSITFGIAKANTTLAIEVQGIVYGQKANITVTVENDATGYITVRINETRNVTLPVVNGKVNWIVDNLPADNYTVYANYSGNAKYNINSTDRNFEVAKAAPTITIESVEVDSLTNATVTLTINSTASGLINITVNNKNYTGTIENGVAKIKVDILPVDEYDITATYEGDDNYTGESTTLVNGLKVIKTGNYPMNVTADDTTVGANTTVTVNVPKDATGTVTIWVNGTKLVNTTIVNGKATFNVTKDMEGRYVVNATLSDVKYANQTVTTAYWVSKVDTPMSITVVGKDSIYVGDTVQVIVTVPSDIKENVTVEINGKPFTNASSGGIATFYIPSITYGNKTVVSAYVGDNKYRYNSTTANFTVHKRNSYVKVNVTDADVGGLAVVNVSVPANATGYVIISVDGQNYTINLTDGNGSYKVKGLANGTYRVTATYLGDDQYLSSINNTQSIKVNKVSPSIKITVSENGIIANGSDVDITVEVPDDATGKIRITLSNGTSYDVYVNDGEGKLHLTAPAVGTYDITAEYLGDDKYQTNDNTSSFEVYRNTKQLAVEAQDTPVNITSSVSVILIGEHGGEVCFIITNASGEVYRNNVTLSNTTVEGQSISTAALTLPLLDAGDYNVEAYYIEYNGTKVVTYLGEDTFNVYKLASEIKIKEITNTTVGNDVVIELEIELDPRMNDGNISVFVNGVEYKTNTSNLTVKVITPPADIYDVKAYYYGNRWYNESDASSVFKVDKNNATLTINVTNSKVGEVEQVNVTVPDYNDGHVILTIDNVTYYGNVTDGVAQFNITGLKAGKHNVTAVYLENNKYSSNKTNTTLTISKHPSTVTVKVDNIIVGDVAAVNITVTTGANGNVTIKIGDEYETTVGVVDGTFSVIVSGLTAGNKTVDVTYNGDDRYLNRTNSTNFTVGKASANINLVTQNITYGEIESLIAFINATGNATIKLDDNELETVDIVNGKVKYDISSLTAGNYTVEIIYNGNTQVNSTSVKANFTVAKADPVIRIEVIDIPYGDVELINITSNAAGNVTVKINGETKVVELTLENGRRALLMVSRWNVPSYNGKATVEAQNLEVGRYDVEATYNGNENYNTATVTDHFNVYKVNTTVDLEIKSSIKVGETQLLNITVNNTNATGNVTINIDGKNYTAVLTDGVTNFTTPVLSAGNHSVVVIYEGDRNLNGNWTSAIFEVTKEKSNITVDVSDIKVSEKETITVHVPEGATGSVIITVDGKNYTANISDDKAVLELDNLENKTYDVHAKYLGDEKYASSENDSSFKVNKVVGSEIKVAADNITVGENAVVKVTLPEDATGNVTVTIGDITKTVPIKGGENEILIPGVPVGEHDVDVIYNGDGKYEVTLNSTKIKVSPKTTDEIKVIDHANGTVTVVVGYNATGNVTIKVGNNTYNATVVNGTAVVNVDNETPGVHDIEVIYSGDENHTGTTKDDRITIPKLESPITVNADNIKVGDKVVIEVILPEDATGNVTVEINGISYTTDNITDNIARFEIENLTYGNKTVAVRYSGDGTYLENFTTANFTVEKRESFVTVETEPVNAGDDAVITVHVPENATGFVHITVNNQTYAVKVNNGIGKATIRGLKNGTYLINATYIGDEQYLTSNSTGSVEVFKVPSSVNITVEDIKLGETVVINITAPEDYCGNVTVSVDGENHTVFVSGGHGILPVSGLGVGNHTVNVTFNGCGKYEASKNSTTFEVSPKTTDEIKVVDLGNGTVTVVVGDNATGNVTVKVGNNTYNATVVNGTAVVQIGNETPGVHDIEVIYSGDENHTAATKDATVTLPKWETPIRVTVTPIEVGETETIRVEVPQNATGNIKLTVDGKTYTAEIKDGIATFSIENLTYGNKTVAVEYDGDDNYLANHTLANLTVTKTAPAITVKATNTTVGNKTVIEVTVPKDATKSVLIDVDGVGYYVNLTDGKGTLEVPVTKDGKHNVTARYVGDDKYESAEANVSFNVNKVPSAIEVKVDNITYGDVAIINITVPEDATGNVSVEIDGKTYNVSVSNGKGTLVVPNLKVANYTVNATYLGDDKYESSKASTGLEVAKTPTDDIKVVDQGNGTVVVIVGDNATGNVTVKVGNNTYNATVVNGTAVVNVDNETPGVHDIEVIYSGDDRHAPATADSKVTVPKQYAPITVDVNPIKVGDKATVTVNLPEDATGNVTIEIDGKKYTAEIKDGKAVFSVENLSFGNKTIAVDYGGDDNYLANHTTSNITVSKRESEVTAKITDAKVGENVTVTVTVPKDATGQVLIDIDGVGYYVNVTNGTGTVEIPRIPSGNYDVVVTYTGDDKYLPSSSKVGFEVDKVPSFVIPNAEDIIVGDNEQITLIVPEDATGTVTVVVDGKEYDFNLDDDTLGISVNGEKHAVAVNGGNGKLVISGLPKGEYTVSVKYNGDDKYLAATNTTTFKVIKKSTDMTIVDEGNGTVVVSLPEDATGNVTVKIGNETYNATVVNGTAVVDLTDAAPGKHDIEVIYSGDDTHETQGKDSTVTIPKHDTPLTVDVENIQVGDKEIVTVTLPDGATGSVTVEINGKNYTSEVKDGKAVFEIPDLSEGDKTVVVKYSGDDNYLGNVTTSQFTVSKVSSTVKATGKDIKVGKDEVITVTVPKDATGRVLVDINGVGYYGTIVNGKAKVVIPELPAGKYAAKVKYEGDDKYLPSDVAIVKFTVTKSSTPIKATPEVIKQGDDATVVVKVPEDATGTVTITVDGKKYTTEVENGQAVFVIPGLSKGDHKVTASYSGDKYYDANDTITDIDVKYNDSPDNPESHKSGSHGGIDLTRHATGNPVWILLLIILAVTSSQIRRFKN